MGTKHTLKTLLIGICLFAVFALSLKMFMKARASARIHAAAGAYVFNRAGDGAKFTCDLQSNGVYFGSLEIPGTNHYTLSGEIPTALTRSGNGPTGARGLAGKWELRNGNVYLVIDGQKSGTTLVMQDRNLVTPDGFTYVRAK